MKNLKNMLVAAAMTVVLGIGTVSANSGFIISDKTSTTQPCSIQNTIFNQIAGIIIVGAPMLKDGIIIVDRKECSQPSDKDGIIIVDRDGIIIVD